MLYILNIFSTYIFFVRVRKANRKGIIKIIKISTFLSRIDLIRIDIFLDAIKRNCGIRIYCSIRLLHYQFDIIDISCFYFHFLIFSILHDVRLGNFIVPKRNFVRYRPTTFYNLLILKINFSRYGDGLSIRWGSRMRELWCNINSSVATGRHRTLSVQRVRSLSQNEWDESTSHKTIETPCKYW